MADLQEMSRVLYHHDWQDIEDWARNVADLADLSDDQIGQLECCCSDGACPDTDRKSAEVSATRSPLQPAEQPPVPLAAQTQASLAEQTPAPLGARILQFVTNVRGALRFNARPTC